MPSLDALGEPVARHNPVASRQAGQHLTRPQKSGRHDVRHARAPVVAGVSCQGQALQCKDGGRCTQDRGASQAGGAKRGRPAVGPNSQSMLASHADKPTRALTLSFRSAEASSLCSPVWKPLSATTGLLAGGAGARSAASSRRRAALFCGCSSTADASAARFRGERGLWSVGASAWGASGLSWSGVSDRLGWPASASSTAALAAPSCTSAGPAKNSSS